MMDDLHLVLETEQWPGLELTDRVDPPGWKLRRDRVTVYDADGNIARCDRVEDAGFILDACRGRTEMPEDAMDWRPDAPSPSVWCRDELATGCEPERRLRDGRDRPIITLYVDHPRSGYNEDFILQTRNRLAVA